MGNLYIIHDFSPSRVWLYQGLAAQSGSLAQYGLDVGPFSDQSCEPVRTHTSLWNADQDPDILAWDVETQIEGMKSALANDRDIVLFGQQLEFRHHEFFINCILPRLGSNLQGVRGLFIMGAPGQILENWHREYGLADVAFLHDLLANFPALINIYKQRFGPDNCMVAGNAETKMCNFPDRGLFGEVSRFLSVELAYSWPVPFHPLLYRSHACRRLWQALEARWNAWPGIDRAGVQASLLDLDASLPEDYLSPQEWRFKFSQAPLREVFAKLCGQPQDIFAVNDDFCASPVCDVSAPLSKNIAKKFIAKLRGEDRLALHARLKNDSNLLSVDQHVLLSALDEFSGPKSIEVSANPPVLTVLTMTYNQERYIGECMDSVLAQKTGFPVEHIVLDHHSTDGTARIVANYAAKYPSIRPVLLSQRAWAENVYGLLARCRGKYAILCDGDDYFTDPDKLQCQVDYLERHPYLSFCFHPVAAVYEDGSPTKIFPPLSMMPKKAPNDYELADLVDGNFIQTNSVLYRWRFSEGLPVWFRPDLCPGDWYLHMLHAETGKFGFIPRLMSVYRRHAGALFSASSTSSVELRRKVGLAELRTLQACIDHFDRKFAENFANIACKVFADFAFIAKNEGDSSLLDFAMRNFPQFAQKFAEAR